MATRTTYVRREGVMYGRVHTFADDDQLVSEYAMPIVDEQGYRETLYNHRDALSQRLDECQARIIAFDNPTEE